MVALNCSMINTMWHMETICAVHKKLNNCGLSFRILANTGDDHPEEPKNGDYIAMPERGRGSGDNDGNKDRRVIITK